MRRPVTVPGGAAALAERIAETGAEWCWLDGTAPAEHETPTSYLGIAAEVRHAERGRELEFLEGLERLDGHAEGGARDPGAAHTPHGAETAATGGFSTGWVVALGYEFGVAMLGCEPHPDDAAPGLALRLDVVIAVTGETGELRAESEAAIDAWLGIHGQLLAAGQTAPGDPAGAHADGAHVSEREPREPSSSVPDLPAAPAWRRSDAEYAAEVEQCKRLITDGEAYVICLTDTAELPGEFDPLELFLRLRAAGSASRGGVIVTRDRALVSASPERFLSVSGGRIATHPIKGTRPRGATPAEDLRLIDELAGDPKERAENLMIVDLMRNDLSRVCVPGSVAVSGFLRVETHPHVHQLVSTVSGHLADGIGWREAVAACFPGGSMTGAPKRRAVEILLQLEAGPRGLYAGCFGWVDDTGDVELAMTIRGAELREGRALIGAGGGITADSVPVSEVAEKHLKAGSLLAALRG